MAKPVTDLEKIIGRNTKYDGQEEAEALMAWVEKPESVALTDFLWQRKMPHKYLYELAAKDSKLSDCLQLAYCKLSQRREQLALNGDLPGFIYSKSQGQYDKGLRMYEKNMAKYNQDIRAAASAPPAVPNDKLLELENKLMEMQHERDKEKIENERMRDKLRELGHSIDN
jgi:hypothetical protein